MTEKVSFSNLLGGLNNTHYEWERLSPNSGPYFCDISDEYITTEKQKEKSKGFFSLNLFNKSRPDLPRLILRTNYLDSVFLGEKENAFEKRYNEIKNAKLGDNTIITTFDKPAGINLNHLQSADPIGYYAILKIKEKYGRDCVNLRDADEGLFSDDYGKFYINLESHNPILLGNTIISLADVQQKTCDFIDFLAERELKEFEKTRK